VFANIVVADEINRASPKTQSALLEAMEEGQVSVDGTSHTLPRPFLVAATQNPVEYEGTYPLPEAQLDRFLLKVVLPVPDRGQELEIVNRHASGDEPQDVAPAGVTPDAGVDDIPARTRPAGSRSTESHPTGGARNRSRPTSRTTTSSHSHTVEPSGRASTATSPSRSRRGTRPVIAMAGVSARDGDRAQRR
jgi:MoxR-like ATPase